MSKKNEIIFKILLFTMAFLNLFLFLDSFPVCDWDEARHGVSAYEMLKSGNFVAHTYLENLDYWNLKPPLGLWLIALAYKLFGFSVFSLRFFSALAGFLSIILCYKIWRFYFDKYIALLATAFLSLSNAFIFLHSGRTGDFDSFFSFIFVFTAYIITFKKEDYLKWFLLGILVALSFFVKSFAAIQVFLLIFLYYLFEKKLIPLNFILLFTGCIIPVLIWAYFRFQIDGLNFFQKMISYDLLHRSNVAIEGHPGTNLHYLEPLLLNNLFWSLFLIPASLYKNKIEINKNKGYHIFLKLNEILSHHLVLSWLISSLAIPFLVKTKCAWYVNSAHPVMALITGWYVVKNEKLNFKKWILSFLVFNFLGLWVRTLFLNEQNFYNARNYQIPVIKMAKDFKNQYYFDPENAYQADIFILEVIGGGKIYRGETNCILWTRNIDKFKDSNVLSNVSGWFVIQR